MARAWSTSCSGSSSTRVSDMVKMKWYLPSRPRVRELLSSRKIGVLPVKVLKEDKAEYIQALVDTRERDDIGLFCRCMTELHCRHLQADIDQYERSTDGEMVDKSVLKQKMVDKWSIKPTLAEKLADILVFVGDKGHITTEVVVNHFGFTPTTAKRYLRQLTEFGYLEAQGGNRNRSYRKR